ncbi:non-muscle cofilin 1-like [Pseudoliparis swirei]|uniref:non-muscle cofilin 1-like n=1 Tax=Pseudoliparis swirei TaxID=2059687 RepID=UPI0024BEAF40|nr:non-muscle cofilin 1-like [Pseudoliparis swirei]
MSSGIQVADEVKEIFNKMKVVKSDTADKDRIRLVTFTIAGNIVVEKCFLQSDLEDDCDVFKFLQTTLLTKTECRYILYDCHFETKESSRKEELVYMMWAPDTAQVKLRMNYAASNSAMERIVDGVKHKLQINDLTYIDRLDFTKRLGNVHKLEGHDV